MGAAATSGGLLIAFTLILLILILGITALVRFKAPTFWQDSSAADYYRKTFRTIILLIIGGIIAVTVAIPRWTRSSPAFSDSFIGMGMFETCACTDPATLCGEAAGFRAVQGFSVLGLLALAGTAVVSAVGATMQLDEQSQSNAQNPPTIGSTSPSASPPAPSPEGARVRTAAPNSANTSKANNNEDDDDTNEEGPNGDNTPGSSLPQLISLILLVFALFTSFFAWIIFAARSLNDACNNIPLYNVTMPSTNLGWGWVFRFFEWLFITIMASLFFCTSRKMIESFDFSMSRLHILSLIVFCMSCLSTTTSTWSTKSEDATSTTATVGAFFACRCADASCPGSKSAQDAAIAFYILFFIFFVPRTFYVLATTRVWQHALAPLYNCCDGIGVTEKINGLKDKIPSRIASILSGVFALLIPLFLMIAICIATGIVASEKCGMSQQTVDIGLVFSVLGLFLCAFEGFVAFLDALFPVGGAMTNDEEEGDAQQKQVEGDDQPEGQQQQQGSEEDGFNQQQQTPSKKKNGKKNNTSSSVNNAEGGEDNANFSGVVMAPPQEGEDDGATNGTPSSASSRNNHKFNNPYVANNNNTELQPQQQQRQQQSPRKATKNNKQQRVAESPVNNETNNNNNNARMSPADADDRNDEIKSPSASSSARAHSRSNSQQQQQVQMQQRMSNNNSRDPTPRHGGNGQAPPPPPPRVQQAVARVDSSE